MTQAEVMSKRGRHIGRKGKTGRKSKINERAKRKRRGSPGRHKPIKKKIRSKKAIKIGERSIAKKAMILQPEVVSIWIQPMPKPSRRIIYEELKDQPDKIEELKNKVFLPEKAYPKRKGRKPKYDFLLISVEGINKEIAFKIAQFLNGYLHRYVVWYPVNISSSEGKRIRYHFIMPWRDTNTSKSIKTGKGVFRIWRGKIRRVIRESRTLFGDDYKKCLEEIRGGVMST